MTDPLCTVPECGTPSPYAFLCPQHVRTLTRVLAEMPSALQDLSVTIARQANAGGRGGGKAPKAADHPLPIDLRAAHLMDMVRNGLSTTIRGLAEDRGLDTPQLGDPMRPVTAAAMSRWLLAHVDSITAGHTAGDIYTATLAIQRALKQAVDNQGKKFMGRCPARVVAVQLAAACRVHDRTEELLTTTSTGECGADLYARPNAGVITCRDCGAELDPKAHAKRIIQLNEDYLGSATFIANAMTDAGYPIKAERIRKWAQRSREWMEGYRGWMDAQQKWAEGDDPLPDLVYEEHPIVSESADDRGVPIYRFGDVLDRWKAEREARQSQKISA